MLDARSEECGISLDRRFNLSRRLRLGSAEDFAGLSALSVGGPMNLAAEER